jgi:hypothetical protein
MSSMKVMVKAGGHVVENKFIINYSSNTNA